MTLGQRILQIRSLAGLSQEEFGAKLGATRQTVSKWELDQTIPEIGRIVQISKLFSVTTGSLLVDGISTFDIPCKSFVCGVYKSGLREIVETEKFTLVYYCSPDHLRFGTKLYKGMGSTKRLYAACEYDKTKAHPVYVYETESGGVCSNDKAAEEWLSEVYDGSQTDSLKRTEVFYINHQKTSLPGVDTAGIKKCLELWRMSDFYQSTQVQMKFLLCTGRTEYVFQIMPEDTNIYCGISYNIPYDLGMMGGTQFFRIRNYQDNSQPWCRFYCNLGYEYQDVEVPIEESKLKECVRTKDGYLLWGVKRYTNDKIVLQGCEDDSEYSYYRNADRDEMFSLTPDL